MNDKNERQWNAMNDAFDLLELRVLCCERAMRNRCMRVAEGDLARYNTLQSAIWRVMDP